MKIWLICVNIERLTLARYSRSEEHRLGEPSSRNLCTPRTAPPPGCHSSSTWTRTWQCACITCITTSCSQRLGLTLLNYYTHELYKTQRNQPDDFVWLIFADQRKIFVWSYVWGWLGSSPRATVSPGMSVMHFSQKVYLSEKRLGVGFLNHGGSV